MQGGESDGKTVIPITFSSLGLLPLALSLTFSPDPLQEACSDTPTLTLDQYPSPCVDLDHNPHHTLLNLSPSVGGPSENNVSEGMAAQ